MYWPQSRSYVTGTSATAVYLAALHGSFWFRLCVVRVLACAFAKWLQFFFHNFWVVTPPAPLVLAGVAHSAHAFSYLPTCMMMLTKLLVSMPSYQGVAKRSCFRLLNCSSNTRVVSVCIVRSLYGFKLLRATPIGSLEVLCVDRG